MFTLYNIYLYRLSHKRSLYILSILIPLLINYLVMQRSAQKLKYMGHIYFNFRLSDETCRKYKRFISNY